MASVSPQIFQALTGESDLWVLPTAEHSRWFARIDWYLNWQMSKGLAYNRPEPSPGLLHLLEVNSIPYSVPPNADRAPLMVASAGRVPAGLCVVLPFGGGRSLRDWLGEIQTLSGGLNPKRMRVFLPAGSSVKDALAAWAATPAQGIEVEFSNDEDHIQ